MTEKVLRTHTRKKNHTRTHTPIPRSEGNRTRFWEGNFTYYLTGILAHLPSI